MSGYLLLRSAVADPATRARYAAVLGICGHGPGALYSLQRLNLFRTLHPMPIILKPSAPSMPGSMVATALFSVGVFTLLYVASWCSATP